MSLPLAHADTLPEPEPRKPRGAHLRALNTPPDAPDAPEAPRGRPLRIIGAPAPQSTPDRGPDPADLSDSPLMKPARPVPPSKAVLQDLIEGQGFSYAVAAKRLGLPEHTVRRAARHHDVLSPISKSRPAPITEEDRKWIEKLTNQGAPMTWVAESVGRNADYLCAQVKHLPGRDEAAMEWKRVWNSIRRNDVLYALHLEFAPR